MPVEGFARIAGSCPAGVFELMMTWYFPCGLTTIPSSRNAGFPFRLISRLSEKTTSADVSGVAVREVDVLAEVEDELHRVVRGLE